MYLCLISAKKMLSMSCWCSSLVSHTEEIKVDQRCISVCFHTASHHCEISWMAASWLVRAACFIVPACPDTHTHTKIYNLALWLPHLQTWSCVNSASTSTPYSTSVLPHRTLMIAKLHQSHLEMGYVERTEDWASTLHSTIYVRVWAFR